MIDITVVIPHIPVREHYLMHALESVSAQTVEASVIVITDENHEGAAVTRNRGLALVETEFVALLDDDDYFYPHHLEVCLSALREHDADVVYPWFDVIGGTDPLGMFGKPFDPEHLKVSNYIPVTVVAKTATLKAVGGFTPYPDAAGHPNEDWGCWLAIHNAGGKIVHVPNHSWAWRHDSGNTSGRGDRW